MFCINQIEECKSMIVAPESRVVTRSSDFKWATVEDMMFNNLVPRIICSEPEAIKKAYLVSNAMIHANELGILEQFFIHLDRFQTVWNHNQKAGNRTIDYPGLELNGELRIAVGRWICDEKGVYIVTVKDKSEKKEFACHNPILPFRRFYDLETKTEKLEIWYYADKNWDSVTVPREMVANRSKIHELASLGLLVDSSTAKLFVEFITEFLALNDAWLIRTNTISRMGRYENDVVPYTNGVQFTQGGNLEPVYQALVNPKGTVQEWVDYMLPLMKKNMPLRLAIAASCASMLVGPLEAQSFVFYMWGPTELGKSVSMKCAMSIWGDPHMGKLVGQLNSTINAIMEKLAFLYSFPCAYDDKENIRDRLDLMEKAIMTFCEQTGRERLDSSSLFMFIKTWKNILFLNGENTLTQYNFGGGAVNRVFEVEVKEAMFADGGAVERFVYEHHGAVGRQFVDELLKADTKKLRTLHQSFVSQIRKGSPTAMNKQLQAAGLLALGYYLFERYILQNENPDMDEVIDALCKSCKTKKEVDVAERTADAIVAWYNTHYKSFYNENLHTEPQTALCFGKIKGRDIYIYQNLFVDELAKMGFDFKAVKERLYKMNLLRAFPSKTSLRYTKNTSVHGIAATCVVLNLDFIKVDEDEKDAATTV